MGTNASNKSAARRPSAATHRRWQRPRVLSKLGIIVEAVLVELPDLTLTEIALEARIDRRTFLKLRTGAATADQTSIGNVRDALFRLTGRRYGVEELFEFPSTM